MCSHCAITALYANPTLTVLINEGGRGGVGGGICWQSWGDVGTKGRGNARQGMHGQADITNVNYYDPAFLSPCSTALTHMFLYTAVVSLCT